MKVLIAEDDANILAGIIDVLEDEGYEPIAAHNGHEAISHYKEAAPDFVILDIMMPGLNGYDVCRSIRREDTDIPIIFLSAKSEEIDKVIGLELGADDYIMKPFGIKEFLARIRAISRRCLRKNQTTQALPSTFQLDDIEVFPSELRARRGELCIDLNLRDLKILTLLHEHPGKVLDRNTLFNACWGLDYAPNSRALDQHISQLRKKIEHDPKEPKIIQTVHGAGYRYDPPET